MYIQIEAAGMGAAASASSDAMKLEQAIRQRCGRMEDDVMFMLGKCARHSFSWLTKSFAR